MKLRLRNETDSLKKVGLYNDIAWEYSLSNYDSSLKYTEKAIRLATELQDDYWQAVSLEMMALLKEISGHIEEAAQLYMQVIKIREKLGGEGLESTYNNLGILFDGQENHPKAFKYYYKSYQLELQRDNPEGIAGSLINMAISLTHMNKLDSSMVLMQSALNLATKYNLEYIKNNAYLGLSNYYIISNKLDSALYYCLQIINSPIEVEPESLIIAQQNTGDIYLKMAKYKKALVHLNNAEALAAELNNLEYFNRLYASKAEVLAATGFYEQAYSYLQKYTVTQDSLINKETLTVLHDLEQKYETAKKEKQITELQLAAAQSRNQRNVYILIASFGGLVIILLILLLRSKSKTNLVISTSLSEKETLLKEIHHRVKNNLQIISSLLSLQAKYIDDKKAIQAVNEGKSRVKAMALIHQKLYQRDNLTGLNMQDYIQNLVESLLLSYGIKPNRVKVSYAIQELRLDIDSAIPLGLILNELVSNSLKYAYTDNKGELMIGLKLVKEDLILTVKDNGPGFDSNTSTQGYGSHLIKSLSRKLKASVLLDSTAGTSYILTIKNYKLV